MRKMSEFGSVVKRYLNNTGGELGLLLKFQLERKPVVHGLLSASNEENLHLP